MNRPRPFTMPKIGMPPTGVYPGSGVAPGGQQGRPMMAHNGFGGARAGGGPQIGASRPRPGSPAFKPATHQQLLAALMATAFPRR